MHTGPVDTRLPLWAPAAVESTDREGSLIKVRLPGVIPGSIMICMGPDSVVISGTSASRRYRRAFLLLPQKARDRIETRLRDEILEIRIPSPRVSMGVARNQD